jgi:hypothetical protein
MVERLELNADSDGSSMINAVGTLSNAVVSGEINQIFSSEESTNHTEGIAEVTDEQNEYNQSVSESESNDEISSVGEESEVDFNDFFAGDFGQGEGEESHNKPSITGFKLE